MGKWSLGTKKVLGLTIAVALTLIAQPACTQDLSVLAEIPRIGASSANALFVRNLARGGPPFLVMVSADSVQVWPVGRAAEPIVSAGVGTANSAWGDFDGDGLLDLAVVRPLPEVAGPGPVAPAPGAKEIVILKGNASGSVVEVAANFVAYAVINDGPRPGQGTDDGSFVLGIPER